MAQTSTLVSVIMPAHNSAQWISASVNSVLAQTYQNLELIVIDAGSNDPTTSILKDLANRDPRLKVIERQTCSGGPATPRNDGINIAAGEYFAFIDSDDLWHPQKLELQLTVMSEQNLNFLSSKHIPFAATPPSARPINQANQVLLKTHSDLIRKNWVVTSSAVVLASLLKEVRFNEKAEYVGIEDYLVWLQLHQKKSINSGALMSPLVFYRLRKNSISASKRMMAKKIFYLLSHYSYAGKPLGMAKYYYFATYAFSAIKSRLLC